jgi:hypothetical protein
MGASLKKLQLQNQFTTAKPNAQQGKNHNSYFFISAIFNVGTVLYYSTTVKKITCAI